MKFFHPYAAPIIQSVPHVPQIVTDEDLRNVRDLMDELKVYRDTTRRDLQRQRIEFFEEELLLRTTGASDVDVRDLETEYHTAHKATLAQFLALARSYANLACEVRRHMSRK